MCRVGPSIAADGNHTCAVTDTGTVRCWGQNFGNTPVTVSGLTGVTQIAAGYYHFCAVLSDGSARCWGYNSTGALGNNTTLLVDTYDVAEAVKKGVELTNGRQIGRAHV